MKNKLKSYLGLGFLLISFAFYKFEKTSNSLPLDNIPFNMVLIPGGKFLMGSDGVEAFSNEMPVHEVIIDSFFMDQCHLTNTGHERLGKFYADLVLNLESE